MKKLSSKILSAVFAGMAVILIAASLLAFCFTRLSLERSVLAQQLEITRQTLDKIDRLLNERILNVQAIAGAPPIKNALIPGNLETSNIRNIASKRIEEFTEVTGPWDLLMMVDRQEKIIISSDEKLLGTSMQEQPQNNVAYQTVMRQDFYYSDMIISENTGQASILFAAPVHDTNMPGQPVTGAVIGHFSSLAIMQILQDVPAFAKLVNHEGAVIVQNAGTRKDLLTQFVSRDIQDHLKQGHSGVLRLKKEQSLSGVASLASFAAQSGYLYYQGSGWGLILEKPASSTFVLASMTSIKLVGLMVPIILIGVLFMVALMNQWVITPITELIRTTRLIAEGDLTKKVLISSQDEIGQLAAAFNVMTEKLVRFYENLEAKIAQRTEELRTAEENLSTTLRSIGDAVISTDADGKVNFLNPIAENLTGWLQAEAYGRPLKEIFHIINEDTRQEVESPVTNVLREGVIVGLANHTILISKNGKEIPLNDSGAPIRDKEGKLIGVVMVFQDVTEHRRAEQKLREKEELYRLIIETANDAFISINEKGEIVEWNRQAELMLGWLQGEVFGRLLEEIIIPSKYRSAHRKGIQHFLITGEGPVLNKRIEISALHRDGHEFPVELTVWPIKGSGGHSFNAFIRDISERQQLHNQLIQSEKLVAIGTLAAGIAHEINNPVGFIGSNLSVLSKYLSVLISLLDMAKKLREAVLAQDAVKSMDKAKEMALMDENLNSQHIIQDVDPLLSESQEGIERIKKIVNDLKTFSRSDNGAIENLDLQPIVDAAVSLAWNEIKYKAELKKEYGPLPLIQCDSQKIGQVIVNLLINAVHAIPEKGVISIRTYLQGPWACIEIKDSGAGIPPEIMNKIFDPFFTTKGVGKGTGLGLSISHEIVKKHGGRIDVQSHVGQGSTFTVFLPTATKETPL